MEQHYKYTDEQFEVLFESGKVEAEVFTHEAHLRLAWLHIHKYGCEQAIRNVCVQLKAFVTLLGAGEKYNITLTIAGVKAVNYFINRSKADNFCDFIEEFPKLKFHFRDLMALHYQTDIFTVDSVKGKYLEPELLAF